jgi:hypothetical protein
MFYLINTHNIKLIKEKLGLKDDNSISDTEIEEILKDPKYSSIANSLDVNNDNKGKVIENVSTDSILNSASKSVNKLDKISSISDNSNILSHIDPIEYSGSQDKTKKETYFKDFDFITKEQARYLMEVLKQPVFYNMLPMQGKEIVDVF